MKTTFCVDVVRRQTMPVEAETVEEALVKARAYLNTLDSSIEIEGVFADDGEMIWDEATCQAVLDRRAERT